MIELENAFSSTESIATAAAKSAAGVVSQARALAKAAQTGNIAGIKRSQEKLDEALEALGQEVASATSCWPYTEDDERRLFDEDYVHELRTTAARMGLKMYEQDGRLVSYPFIVRILAADRAVQIDRKKVSTIRPSYLVDLLLKNQKKSSGFNPQRFLESLYAVYTDIAGGESPTMLSAGSGRVVPLIRIYKLITALPGAARDYDRSDFVRDLYALDSQGPRRTKNGAAVAFPASTGTRMRAGDQFSFIGPDGDRTDYYGIRFSGSGE